MVNDNKDLVLFEEGDDGLHVNTYDAEDTLLDMFDT